MKRATLLSGCASLFVFAALSTTNAADAAEWTLASPDEALEITVRDTPAGGLEYTVSLQTENGAATPVDWSSLGPVIRHRRNMEMEEVISDFSSSITFSGETRTTGVDSYTMKTGKQLENNAPYNALTLSFTDDETDQIMELDLRAYDDGVAFRYVLPEASPVFHEMTHEATAFNIGEGGVHWGAPYDFYTMYHPSYETFYERNPTGTSVSPEAGVAWGFPSLFEQDGAYVLIHEAGLDAGFHGSHLDGEAPGGVYSIVPPVAEEAEGYGQIIPASPLPWTMPWRFMIVSDNYADIVESNLVHHLAKPSQVEETDWIEPGIVTWHWLSDHDSGKDFSRMTDFIDLAADLDIPYTLIDAEWPLGGDNALERLVDYADKKGVGLMFWYNSGGRHNIVPLEPRNRLNDPISRRAEFARLQELGVKGIKVDFFQSDKQDMIALYEDIMRDAAEFELMTNFHGSTIPRGWSRTWPNLMTMEAVRGAEFYSFSGEQGYGMRAPSQNAIHPFLRNVIGPMDYTPVHFSQFAVNRLTTNAHEAALAVVFESGLLHLSDSVAGYRSLPQTWQEFISSVPTAWDETKLVEGVPGDYAVLARRSGDTWYIAGINGQEVTQQIDIDLEALPGFQSTSVLLEDMTEDAGGNGFSSRTVSADTLSLEMKPFGGFVLAPSR